MSANTWNKSGTTWSQGLWGEQDSNLIDLTGVSASFSLGEIVTFAEQGWGRDDWGTEPWGESFDPVIAVSGFSLTASLGTTTDTYHCLLYTSPSPRDGLLSRMPSSA